MSLARILQDGYREALRSMVMGTSPESLARARETAFIKRLLEGFSSQYSAEEYRVFCQLARGNRADFGSESLLGDIAVCRIAESSGGERKRQNFRYVSALIWQVEIDFSREWRRAIYAINRLNCGAAENKLFISAQAQRGGDARLRTLLGPLEAGPGEAYIALIPHPRDWETSEKAPQLWHLRDGQWIETT